MPETEQESLAILRQLNSAPRTPEQVDGWLSFAGGVDGSAQHRNMRIDQLEMLVNGTVRDGRLCTRPGFRQLQIAYRESEDQQIVERGKVQGYKFWNGLSAWAIDGHLFLYEPDGEVRRVDPATGRALSNKVDHIFFEERAGALIAQDGKNPAVIIEGSRGRFADRQLGEVGSGTLMADGWGRLALADATRRRIFFSDHEMNPESDALRFDAESGSYYLSAPYFTVPERLGPLQAMAFLPYLDTDTGVGPLLAFGRHGTMAYNVNVDRSQWGTQDIASMILPSIGAAGPYAVAPLAAEMVFIDQNGRIRSIRNARDEEATINVRPFDREVFRLYEDEAPDLRKWRMIWSFDNRIFAGIQPQSVPVNSLEGRYNVYMNGMVVRELDPAAPYAGTEQPVWSGVWTGVKPLGVVTGVFRGQERAIILSRDDDGKNRFYEQTRSQEFDTSIAPNEVGAFFQKQIEWEAWFRRSDFDLPKTMKSFHKGSLSLEGIQGPIEITASWESDVASSVKWFEHREHWANRMKVDFDRCLYISPGKGARRSLRLPALQDGADPTGNRINWFLKGRPVLRMKGRFCISEMILETEAKEARRTDPVNHQAGEPIDYHPEDCNPYGYHAATAPVQTVLDCLEVGTKPEVQIDPLTENPIPPSTVPIESTYQNVDVVCEE